MIINLASDRKFNYSKHFLCLMGTENFHRTWLSEYLKSNRNISKGIVSARWLGISPDG